MRGRNFAELPFEGRLFGAQDVVLRLDLVEAENDLLDLAAKIFEREPARFVVLCDRADALDDLGHSGFLSRGGGGGERRYYRGCDTQALGSSCPQEPSSL